MEKFKAVEKEMKTKAFSKEGLSAAAKMDPKDREKEEGCGFLKEQMEELDHQVETLEAEEESLTATTKKGKKDTAKADRLAEISRLTERHKWHQNKLELLLRALENGNVDIEQVNEAKDSIKYYVEENQSPEFQEDEEIYDEFNLEQDEAAWGIGNEVDRVSSQDAQSVQDDIADVEPPKGTGKQKTGSLSEPSGLAARRPSNQMGGKPTLPALTTLTTPLANVTNLATATSMKPAPPPARPPGETLKYASAAAAAASSEKASIAPLPPPPTTTSTLAPLPPPPSKASTSTSPNTVSSVPAVPQKPAAPASVSSMTQASAQSPAASATATASVPPTPALENSEPVVQSRSKSQTLEAPQEEQERSPDTAEPETPPPPVSKGQDQANGVKIQDQEESIFHLPECLSDLKESFEEWKDIPADPTSQPVQKLLNQSFQTCPDVSDVEKPRHYRPNNRYDMPRHYPAEPAAILDDPALYERIDNDTLFFLFYYRQNTYQQHLAAKALKGQSWRFHKQYQTWFQRHEEPKTITEEYEQGTYRFFDYESTW